MTWRNTFWTLCYFSFRWRIWPSFWTPVGWEWSALKTSTVESLRLAMEVSHQMCFSPIPFSKFDPYPSFSRAPLPLRIEFQGVVVEISSYANGQPFKTQKRRCWSRQCLRYDRTFSVWRLQLWGLLMRYCGNPVFITVPILINLMAIEKHVHHSSRQIKKEHYSLVALSSYH